MFLKTTFRNGASNARSHNWYVFSGATQIWRRAEKILSTFLLVSTSFSVFSASATTVHAQSGVEDTIGTSVDAIVQRFDQYCSGFESEKLGNSSVFYGVPSNNPSFSAFERDMLNGLVLNGLSRSRSINVIDSSNLSAIAPILDGESERAKLSAALKQQTNSLLPVVLTATRPAPQVAHLTLIVFARNSEGNYLCNKPYSMFVSLDKREEISDFPAGSERFHTQEAAHREALDSIEIGFRGEKILGVTLEGTGCNFLKQRFVRGIRNDWTSRKQGVWDASGERRIPNMRTDLRASPDAPSDVLIRYELDPFYDEVVNMQVEGKSPDGINVISRSWRIVVLGSDGARCRKELRSSQEDEVKARITSAVEAELQRRYDARSDRLEELERALKSEHDAAAELDSLRQEIDGILPGLLDAARRAGGSQDAAAIERALKKANNELTPAAAMGAAMESLLSALADAENDGEAKAEARFRREVAETIGRKAADAKEARRAEDAARLGKAADAAKSAATLDEAMDGVVNAMLMPSDLDRAPNPEQAVIPNLTQGVQTEQLRYAMGQCGEKVQVTHGGPLLSFEFADGCRHGALMTLVPQNWGLANRQLRVDRQDDAYRVVLPVTESGQSVKFRTADNTRTEEKSFPTDTVNQTRVILEWQSKNADLDLTVIERGSDGESTVRVHSGMNGLGRIILDQDETTPQSPRFAVYSVQSDLAPELNVRVSRADSGCAGTETVVFYVYAYEGDRRTRDSGKQELTCSVKSRDVVLQ